jgi:hypothetical protein
MDSGGSIYTIWEDHREDIGDIYFNLTSDQTNPIANAPGNIQVQQAELGHFVAAGSWDNFGIKNYTWTFNDAGAKTRYGYSAKYLFNNPGVFTVTLTVLDFFGNTDVDTFQVTVTDKTPPILDNDNSDTLAYTGDTYTFRIDASDVSPPLSVFVKYWFGTGAPTVAPMTLGSAPQFTHGITVPLNSLDMLHYNFSARDKVPNWAFTSQNDITVLDNKIPTLTLNTTPTSIGTGNQLTFAVNPSDNIDVLGGSVFYRYGTSGGYTELALVKAGPTYSGSITVDDTLTPIYYYWSFSDTSNNWNNATQSMITIIDDDKPEFGNDHSDTTAETGKMFNFSLEFTDNIAIDSAYVEYKFGSSGSVHVVTLIQEATRFEDSIIIPEATSQAIFYRFFFNDTTAANTNNTDWVQVAVTDGTNPQLVAGSGNLQATTGEGFEVFARFSDNIGINLVTIYYTKTTTWLDKDITSDDGNYSITNSGLTIDTTNDDSNWQYYYVAKDAALNSVNYGTVANPFTITVIDNDKPSADAGLDMDKTLVDTQIEVTLDGSGSSDNIDIDAFSWTFMYNNQQQQLTGEKPTFTFSKAGFYTVTLNVPYAGQQITQMLTWLLMMFIGELPPAHSSRNQITQTPHWSSRVLKIKLPTIGKSNPSWVEPRVLFRQSRVSRLT